MSSLASTRCQRLQQALLYGILDLSYVTFDQVIVKTQQLLEGKIDLLQLRAKHIPEKDILTFGKILADLCHQKECLFILNDYPYLVPLCNADGVHVGQDDLSIAVARQQAGHLALIGKSTHSLEQAQEAQREGADYLGFGPLFSTLTKPDYTPTGLTQLHQLHSCISVPIFCIGGIKKENLAQVLDAGAQRVTIVSGMLQAAAITTYAQECKRMLQTNIRPLMA